jgi:hypothetical protein
MTRLSAVGIIRTTLSRQVSPASGVIIPSGANAADLSVAGEVASAAIAASASVIILNKTVTLRVAAGAGRSRTGNAATTRARVSVGGREGGEQVSPRLKQWDCLVHRAVLAPRGRLTEIGGTARLHSIGSDPSPLGMIA